MTEIVGTTRMLLWAFSVHLSQRSDQPGIGNICVSSSSALVDLLEEKDPDENSTAVVGFFTAALVAVLLAFGLSSFGWGETAAGKVFLLVASFCGAIVGFIAGPLMFHELLELPGYVSSRQRLARLEAAVLAQLEQTSTLSLVVPDRLSPTNRQSRNG